MAADIVYFLHRAETEAVRAIGSDSPPAAAVHQEMCLLYTSRAITGLVLGGLGSGPAGLTTLDD